MAANNSFCGVGIAFDSKVGGMRILDGPITDLVESKAMMFNYDHVDIMSASWGPVDDGRQVGGPEELTRKAFNQGFTQVIEFFF